MLEYENKELCKSCGGRCCKKSGCDYFVSDFSLINKNEIIKALETGNISIVSALMFSKGKAGQNVVTPFLYLRARNIDRDIVDLFSMKRQCSMLTNTGCSYSLENRPSGGVNLIPDANTCYPLLNPVEEIKKWAPYQGLLSKLVKRYTGKSVNEVLRENVTEVFYEVLTKQFDGVDKREIDDILSQIDDLAICFSKEYKQAKEKAKKHVNF